MMSTLKLLRIEVDGHFHGSSDVPQPWVARVDGVDRRYGLARTFIDRIRDWRGYRRSWSGRNYGVVAAFALRMGHLYEVSRLRGRPSKRHVAREFWRYNLDGARTELEPIDALALAEAYAGPVVVADYEEGTRVSVVHGLGTPEQLGWVVVDERRLYRLRDGHVHEIVHPNSEAQLVLVDGGRPEPITHDDALRRLAAGGCR